MKNQTHSDVSFSNSDTRSFVEKYPQECDVVDCYLCCLASTITLEILNYQYY